MSTSNILQGAVIVPPLIYKGGKMYSLLCTNCLCYSYCNVKSDKKGSKGDKACMELRDKEYANISESTKQSLIEEGYRNLATAIVEKALWDIVDPKVTSTMPMTDNPQDFLDTPWCEELSGLNKEQLLKIVGRMKNEKSTKQKKVN